MKKIDFQEKVKESDSRTRKEILQMAKLHTDYCSMQILAERKR